MSRGPGQVERRIRALMEDEPDGAWTIEDVAERVYPGCNRIEKKHRVSVHRAVRRVVNGDPDWCLTRSGNTGSTIILMNWDNTRSYTLGRLKADDSNHYRDKRRGIPEWWIETEESLRAKLAPDGKYHFHVVPGGCWDLHVQMHRARRDGDGEKLTELEAELEVAVGRFARRLREGGI